MPDAKKTSTTPAGRRRDGLGVTLVWGLLGLVARLPLGFHLAVFRVVAWYLEKIHHYRRDELMTNLARSFPEKKYKELKRIRHGVYGHLADLMAEAIWQCGNRGKRGLRRLHKARIVEIKNVAEVNRIYDVSPSLMLLCGHLGNWELLPGMMEMNYDEANPWHARPRDLAFVYKQIHSHLWDRIMEKNRCGIIRARDPEYDGYQESNRMLRYALEHRSEKRLYVFPADQFPYRGATRHDIGTFMNQPTLAMVGGPALASKLGMAVLYTRWTRLRRGRYTIEFVPITLNAKGMDPVDISRRYHALLEEDLQRQPENYLWTHKRWK